MGLLWSTTRQFGGLKTLRDTGAADGGTYVSPAQPRGIHLKIACLLCVGRRNRDRPNQVEFHGFQPLMSVSHSWRVMQGTFGDVDSSNNCLHGCSNFSLVACGGAIIPANDGHSRHNLTRSSSPSQPIWTSNSHTKKWSELAVSEPNH